MVKRTCCTCVMFPPQVSNRVTWHKNNLRYIKTFSKFCFNLSYNFQSKPCEVQFVFKPKQKRVADSHQKFQMIPLFPHPKSESHIFPACCQNTCTCKISTKTNMIRWPQYFFQTHYTNALNHTLRRMQNLYQDKHDPVATIFFSDTLYQCFKPYT